MQHRLVRRLAETMTAVQGLATLSQAALHPAVPSHHPVSGYICIHTTRGNAKADLHIGLYSLHILTASEEQHWHELKHSYKKDTQTRTRS